MHRDKSFDRRPMRLMRLSVLGVFSLAFGLASGCGDDDGGDGGDAGSAGSAGSSGSAGDGNMAGAAGSMAGAAGSMAAAGAAGSDAMGAAGGEGDEVPDNAGGPASNGLEIPSDVFDWRVIGAIDLLDEETGTLRVVVGNDTAVEAARTGRTNPWPDGSMISHYVWTRGAIPNQADIVAPGDFGALTLMVKDSDRYADDGGWAYANWSGENLEPNPMENFDRGCVNCHTQMVADNDYVFTRVGALPSQSTVDAAVDAPNGVALPAGFLDWRVIGVANRDDNGSVRVVLGNDVAVEAARSGETQPWPEGSMIGHLVWDQSTNPRIAEATVPGAFQRITLMVRDEGQYGDDGGWAYGTWAGPNLDPPAEGFDAQCIECHTDNVADNDYVFTRPGALPE